MQKLSKINHYILDGQKYKLEKPKQAAKIEYKKTFMDFDENVQEINETTELGDALKELNNDNIDNTRMSGIDMRSRLMYLEIASILAVDTLVSFKLLPMDVLGFTRQKKRLAVSLAGKGREEIVKVVGGKYEVEASKSGMSIIDRIRGKTAEPPK